jgi:dipeptidyl-peptidase-4
MPAIALALALGAEAGALAQTPADAPVPLPPLTVEAANDVGLSGPVPLALGWHPDGRTWTFLRRAGADLDVVGIDSRSGRETVLVRGAGGGVGVGGRPGSPLRFASWMPDGRHLLVPAHDDVYLVDIEDSTARALVRTPEREEVPAASPDGKRVAFVRDGDLFVVDLKSGEETRLTDTGSDALLNGRLDWVYEEELGGRKGDAFAWSPDSTSIAFLQLDQAKVQTFPIVDFRPVPSEVTWQRYPTPGTTNATARLGVVTLGRGRPVVRLAAVSPEDAYVAPQIGWTPDSRNVVFQQIDRAQKALQLRLLPVPRDGSDALGPVRTILQETSQSWVNLLAPPIFYDKGRRFVWLSERDGFAHLYACDLSGECRAVTRGRWLVDARVSFSASGRGQPVVLDERTRFLYFRATEKDPRERHLYRVRLDGTGFTRLTTEAGTHETEVSPDGRFYADVFSDADTPPRAWLSSQDGTKRYWIEKNEAAPILGYARGRFEWTQIMAEDGSTLYGSLLVPDDFDPGRRYPVVVSVYGGPHAQEVTRSWRTASPLDRVLVGHGFLVWQLDNRGSAGRGLAFESTVDRHLGRLELEDQLAGVAHLKTLPYVDPERIGITGWSYGGYMTLYALTHAPEVFRAGVAGAPVVDWTRYDTIYTERYMGTPAQNPQGYRESSPLAAADRLRADLLLIHGTADDNVHFGNTVAFAGALDEAGRPYSLRIHPGQKHGFRVLADRVSRDRAIVEFFDRTLK